MSTTATLPASPDPSPPAALGSVLQRLGHRCDDHCPALDPAVGRVWLAWHSRRLASSLVVIDFAPQVDPMSAHHLLRRLNACTRAQQIRVLARQPGDRGRALASLSTRPLVPARRLVSA